VLRSSQYDWCVTVRPIGLKVCKCDLLCDVWYTNLLLLQDFSELGPCLYGTLIPQLGELIIVTNHKPSY